MPASASSAAMKQWWAGSASRQIAHFLRDLHRAELGAAHRAEMRRLGALGGQGLVVILLGGVGIEARLNWSRQRNSKRARESASSRSLAAGWPLARSAAWAASL
jgi:hypothetical protein